MVSCDGVTEPRLGSWGAGGLYESVPQALWILKAALLFIFSSHSSPCFSPTPFHLLLSLPSPHKLP